MKPLHLIIIALCVISNQLHSQQINGRVMDQYGKESLAFVAVVEQGTNNGTYSDIDGYFTLILQNPKNAILFNLVGYNSHSALFPGENPWNVRLSAKENILGEVRIRPGVNPAERIIRSAISNKKKNNPESDIAFTYDSYNKLVFGGNVDSTVMADTAKYAAMDSSDKAMYNMLNEQYIFLMESITQRKFFPPNHSEETIIANRVSGLSNTDFFLLGTQLQSFSFYGESVELLGNSYMSPLADNAISKYLFVIEDTTFIEKDTVFTVSYTPRKGKNFDGMKGSLFINTNGFAIQNVIAEPANPAAYVIHIQQQYEFTDGRKWFPKQLNSSILFNQLRLGTSPLTGEGRSYIKNLKLDAPLKKSEFTPVVLLLAPKAGSQPDSVWNKYRERELDKKELKTYTVIDSVGKEMKLDTIVKVMEALAVGQVVLGKISLDLKRLLRFNGFEGYRLGAGFHTNDFFSPKYSIGGYYAYGFRDTHTKYGGDILVHLKKKRNAWIKATYENDVYELGGNQFEKNVEGLFSSLYPLFVTRMDRREKAEVILHARLVRNISGGVFVNHQYIQPFNGYYFTGTTVEKVSLFTTDFYTTEVGISLRYAPGEKLVRTQKREISLGGRFPVFYLKLTRGIKDLIDGDYDYTRYDAMIEKVFRIQNVGDFSIMAIGGYSPDKIPLSLLYNARGTWQKFTIAVPGSFETMRTNEFQHSQFAALHLRHNFRDLLFQSKHFSPHLLLVHSMLWGKFENAALHNFNMIAADKVYYESGLQIDRLLVSKFSAIGIAAFYRYGPYHLPTASDNFAFKITSSLNF